ncbi:MAG: hypothetical protein Q9227_002419 [Pyrenula ochraceoflavens]
MYNHGHQPQHVMMNGGHGHQRFGGVQMKYQQANHQAHNNQSHHQHAQHSQVSHIGHQHNFSSGTLGSSTPQFPPGHSQNGNQDHMQDDDEPMTEHWQKQLQLAAECRGATSPNHHAKARGSQQVSGASFAALSSAQEDQSQHERPRAPTVAVVKREKWDELDLGGQGLRALSPAVFYYQFLQKLYLNHNNLRTLPEGIRDLKSLTLLDLTKNRLVELPSEIGMLASLKSLYLFDNLLQTLPSEIGYLYRLETLGIAGNPLPASLTSRLKEKGTKELIRCLIEEMPEPKPPLDRELILLDETTSAGQTPEKFTALSYNTLCPTYATKTMYAYVPDRILEWDNRKMAILNEIQLRDADIVCLQEIDRYNYDEFWRGKLSMEGYKSFYGQKSRASTMGGEEARQVDGCSTFWKDKKYIMLDQQFFILGRKAVEREGKAADILNRVWQRDDIATVVLLENRATGSRIIVANVHIFWNPAYRDVQLIQAAVLLEELEKLANKWCKEPPCPSTKKQLFRFSDDPETQPDPVGPSQEYSHRTQIPMLICGDFNSDVGSTVYDLLAYGDVEKHHHDLEGGDYGHYSNVGMTHEFSLKSAYSAIGELGFTNYTPDFTGMLDYIWYSTNSLRLTALLGEIDKEYLRRVPGFPNWHFPSDHVGLFAEFSVVHKKQKTVEADFSGGGASSNSGSSSKRPAG